MANIAEHADKSIAERYRFNHFVVVVVEFLFVLVLSFSEENQSVQGTTSLPTHRSTLVEKRIQSSGITRAENLSTDFAESASSSSRLLLHHPLLLHPLLLDDIERRLILTRTASGRTIVKQTDIGFHPPPPPRERFDENETQISIRRRTPEEESPNPAPRRRHFSRARRPRINEQHARVYERARAHEKTYKKHTNDDDECVYCI